MPGLPALLPQDTPRGLWLFVCVLGERLTVSPAVQSNNGFSALAEECGEPQLSVSVTLLHPQSPSCCAATRTAPLLGCGLGTNISSVLPLSLWSGQEE